MVNFNILYLKEEDSKEDKIKKLETIKAIVLRNRNEIINTQFVFFTREPEQILRDKNENINVITQSIIEKLKLN